MDFQSSPSLGLQYAARNSPTSDKIDPGLAAAWTVSRGQQRPLFS